MEGMAERGGRGLELARRRRLLQREVARALLPAKKIRRRSLIRIRSIISMLGAISVHSRQRTNGGSADGCGIWDWT